MKLSEISRKINIPYTTLVDWVKRGEIPKRQIDYVCNQLGIEKIENFDEIMKKASDTEAKSNDFYGFSKEN